MKIAILSRDGTLYSCRRLREAAQQRGHQIEILDPLSCYMNVSPVASSIHYKGRQLPHFDAVIPRIGSAITYYGTAALRQFELLGSYPLNESVAITRARDKLRSLQLLARQGIDLPLTGIAHSPDDTSDLIAMVGGAPLVVKLVEGTQDRRGAGGDPPGGGERDRRLSRTERSYSGAGIHCRSERVRYPLPGGRQ